MGRFAISALRPDARTWDSVHAGPPERWVDVERVGRNAVAHTPRIIVQQVSGDDFKVVVRGVSESALAVTVPERPDAWHVGSQLVVDNDVASLIHVEAGPFDSQIIRVRSTAHGKQKVRPDHFLRAFVAVEVDDDVVTPLRDADAFGLKSNIDPFCFQNLFDGLRHILSISLNKARAHSPRS